MTLNVLLIGGTGVFGGRLARHVAPWPDVSLTVTARRLDSARAAAASLNAGGAASSVNAIALDRDRDADTAIRALRPHVVIDCSGPFQEQGYGLVRAAIAAGAHVIDLADARTYLLGYREAMKDAACAAGVVALAGASSTPALSGAVLSALTRGWRAVGTVDIAITPAGKSEVGPAVIAAVLSYAGKPVPVWANGALGHVSGWRNATMIAMPGLGTRRVAPVETADAELFGPAFAVTGRLNFYAGLESPVEQLGMETLAFLRAHSGPRSLSGLVPLLRSGRRVTRLLASERGGMVVSVSGTNARGEWANARWSLVADRNQGPFVPVLAAAAALRKLIAGGIAPGAHIASDVLTLAEIEAEAAPYAITTRIEEMAPPISGKPDFPVRFRPSRPDG
jgi:hypothetical protein